MSTKKTSMMLLAVISGFAVQSIAASPPAGKPQVSQRGTAAQPQLPIQIDADRAELTEQQNVSVYTGHVRLKQGDLELAGERLQVQRNPQTGEISATITGSPVTARQDNGSGNPMAARANRVDYTSRDRTLFMQGSAEVVRGKDRINSENIRYNATTQRVTAGNQGGGSGNRVQITIQPGQSH